MFDFLRNLRKSAEEKHQEQLHAYLDNALTSPERQQFEQELAQDAALQAEMDDLRLMKQQLRDLPRRPVPRSFTLDPAVYGRPARQPLFQFYPVLQGATVLTALFFIMALSLSLFQPRAASESVAVAPQNTAIEQEAEIAAEAIEEPAAEFFSADSAADEAASGAASDEEEVLEEIQTITEFVAEDSAETAEEEAAEEEEMEEAEMAEETTAEEAAPEAEADDGATVGEVLPEATAVPPPATTADEATPTSAATLPPPTATPMPTPTVSTLPRASATQTAENRSPQATETASDRQEALTDTTGNTAEPQSSLPSPTSTPVTRETPTTNPLRLAQIGLGLLLILFGALTFYVRRNS